MVKFPPTVATKDMIAQANLLVLSSNDSTLGLANCMTGTFPRNCEQINMNAEIPITELKVLNGLLPTILLLLSQ